MALTQKKIERELVTRPGRYRDERGPVPGLLLIVTAKSASWILRYYRSGRERWHGLGSAHSVTLKQARKKAKAARALLDDGVDPIDARRAAKTKEAAKAAATMTFKQAAETFFDHNAAKWTHKRSRDQFLSSLRDHAFPIVGDLAVAAIGLPAMLAVLEQKVEARRGRPGGRFWDVKPVTAGRVRGRIEAVLGWCTVRGLRSGDNPARWSGNLDMALPTYGDTKVGADGSVENVVKHLGALPYQDLPPALAELRSCDGVAPRALEFTFLTAVRTSEVLGAQWSEFDLAARIWTVPPERMKMRRAHRIPLSGRALEILQELPSEEGSPFVFVGPRGDRLGDDALRTAYKRLGVAGTVHGSTRSGFRDWCAEATNYPREVAELALAHTVGSATSRAYERTDQFAKRAKLMEQWARYLAKPVSTDNVVALRTAP